MEQDSTESEYINPIPPATLDIADNELLRGDAIGDTAYTHRWVLSCLLTIIKNLPKYLIGLESGTPSVDGCSSTKSDQSWRDTISSNKGSSSSIHQDVNCSSDKQANDSQTLIKINEDCQNASTNKVINPNNESLDHSDNENESNGIKLGDIIELDEEVEEAACQLWDMTVEKDVALHLLSLDELDVLQLASQIITSSKSPRLTEVVTGIVANLCCQREGLVRVFEDRNGVLEGTFELLVSTSDIPTLGEVIRLIKLLLWHRINKTPLEDHATCPLLLALQDKHIGHVFAFLASNCLNQNLVTSLFELLESLLFVKLPHQSNSMADHYAFEEMIDCLSDVFIQGMSLSCDNFGKDNEAINIHKAVICLYSFVDTSASKLLQQKESLGDNVLPHLCHYIERIGRTNSPEDLTGDTSDRLISAIGLCQLLIPYLRNASIIQVVAHLLAVTRGNTHHYTASRSNSTEEDAQYMDGDPGWLSPIVNPQQRVSQNQSSDVNKLLELTTENECLKDLKELDDSLCDYCGELFGWWWKSQPKSNEDNTQVMQLALIKKLDECHANEVVLFFKAVRSHDSAIVSRLQEYLLDKGTHCRLVSVLAHMYQ